MPEDDNATRLKNFKYFIEVLDNHKINMFQVKMLVEHEKKEDAKQGANTKTEEEYKKLFFEEVQFERLLDKTLV